MKKKIITTTILALGLLQGASTAYAEDFSQRIGGVGYGDIFGFLAQGFVGPSIGKMDIKLNGILSKVAGVGTYHGDASITVLIPGFLPVIQTVGYECGVTRAPADPTGHQIQVGCGYSPPITLTQDGTETQLNLTSSGQCYITKDDHHRVMACKFEYLFLDGEDPTFIAPVSFSTMF